jgi:hypothetical protein
VFLVIYYNFVLERIWKEVGLGVIDVLSWLLAGGSEENKTSGY